MFRIFSPRRRTFQRNFTLRRGTPVIQCNVGRARDNLTQTLSASDSGDATGRYFSSAAKSFVSDFFGSFKSLHDHAVAAGTDGAIAVDLRIKPVFFITSVIIAVVLSTIMTLVYATNGVTQGYVMRDLQARSQALVRENEVVTMEVAAAQSLDSMTHNDVLLNMRPAQKVMYMSGTSAIASR
jgi:hypothetical protein